MALTFVLSIRTILNSFMAAETSTKISLAMFIGGCGLFFSAVADPFGHSPWALLHVEGLFVGIIGFIGLPGIPATGNRSDAYWGMGITILIIHVCGLLAWLAL